MAEGMRQTAKRSEWERLELRFEELSQHLYRLDAAAAAHVVKYHASVAALLRKRVAVLTARERMQQAAERQAESMPPSPASPHGRRLLRASERKKRDLEVMRLASRGWPNERIARRFGVSPSHVSRIVQRMLRRTQTAALTP